MFRRPIYRVTPGDRLRDYIVRWLCSDEPLRAFDRKMIAEEIKHHWRSDLKRDKRIARFEKAFTIGQQVAELLANDRTMTVAKAKQKLAREHRHNSDKALDKWLRRNRDFP
jgi:hypothetical protein